MSTAEQSVSNTPIDIKDSATLALLAAWILALSASLAVLFIGEVMGQAPCVLCWYQRIAMFPLAVVLGIAAWRGDLGVWRYGLPIAFAGLLVAGFHTLLYYGVIPESITPCGAGPSCTDAEMTIFGLAIPALSLAAFVGLVAFLLQVRKGAKDE